MSKKRVLPCPVEVFSISLITVYNSEPTTPISLVAVAETGPPFSSLKASHRHITITLTTYNNTLMA